MVTRLKHGILRTLNLCAQIMVPQICLGSKLCAVFFEVRVVFFH